MAHRHRAGVANVASRVHSSDMCIGAAGEPCIATPSGRSPRSIRSHEADVQGTAVQHCASADVGPERWHGRAERGNRVARKAQQRVDGGRARAAVGHRGLPAWMNASACCTSPAHGPAASPIPVGRVRSEPRTAACGQAHAAAAFVGLQRCLHDRRRPANGQRPQTRCLGGARRARCTGRQILGHAEPQRRRRARPGWSDARAALRAAGNGTRLYPL